MRLMRTRPDAPATPAGWSAPPRPSATRRMPRGFGGASIVIAILVLATVSLASSQTRPVLSGRFDIDLPRGGISADVCLARLPPGDTVLLVLNRAFTIK